MTKRLRYLNHIKTATAELWWNADWMGMQLFRLMNTNDQKKRCNLPSKGLVMADFKITRRTIALDMILPEIPREVESEMQKVLAARASAHAALFDFLGLERRPLADRLRRRSKGWCDLRFPR